VEKLEGYDAVIATGSNNSARYFEAYFGRKPHIIRRNRNGVAVLTGRETAADLAGIADDALAYFGLGCRNVSKLYVPEGYRFEPLLEALHEHRELVLHNKYKNNFDYNYTLLILNRVEHLANGCVLLIEDRALPSRIASLHYEYYADDDQLRRELGERTADIQCVVSAEALEGWKRIAPGQAQQPGLRDYADGVDTVQFLLGLN
ncbi:MAG: acyl-CoA reductase, partial [Bacteroidota bacterium]